MCDLAVLLETKQVLWHCKRSKLSLCLLSPVVANERSVACSTEIALKWDATFQQMLDPPCRAVMDVHDEAYKQPSKKVLSSRHHYYPLTR